MRYIVVIYAFGLLIQLFVPTFYWAYLSLDVNAIMHGQIWRLITFIIYPPALGSFVFDSILLGVVSLFLYYSLGGTLEEVWGSFRFTVFFAMGMIGQILAAFIAYYGFHQYIFVTTGFLNFSIFLAFAMSFPNVQFLLFFVIPIKAKWLAIAECAVYLYSFIMGPNVIRCEIVLSLINVILFFLMTRRQKWTGLKDVKRRRDFKRQISKASRPSSSSSSSSHVSKIIPKSETRHRCAICGRTEADGDDLVFRYCSKCAGNLEYCQDHLYTHQHVTGG